MQQSFEAELSLYVNTPEGLPTKNRGIKEEQQEIGRKKNSVAWGNSISLLQMPGARA
jgi:hypothetical protein